MPQITALISTLKKQLRASGVTYAHIAKALNISEASVKRLFSEQTFSLQRLENICQLIGLELSDLILLMEGDRTQLQQLSVEQEKEIISDPLLLMIAIYAINQYNFDDICHEIAVSHTECIQKLAHLDRLSIISLLPNNRIKLLVAPNFRWQLNGPIQQFIQYHVKKDFFTSAFAKKSEKFLVLNGKLSDSSRQEIQLQTEKTAKLFNELMLKDRSLPRKQRSNVTLVMATRPWEFPPFDQYRR